MERLPHVTENIIDENVEKLAELFPEVVTEVREPDGSLRHTIDVEALKARAGDVAEGQRERYQFTWPGKRDAKQEAYRQIDKCLRPCPEESVDWDTTQNLYIEGDNLDALKLLRNTYAGKVKMIYIDPPYNTGHDFIYDDDFAQTKADYDAESGEYDEEGGRLVANPESNGRFHSDWCSMIYPRLLLARDLLTEDGVIFISIDDNEQENLNKCCDEVFGESNFVVQIPYVKRVSPANDSKWYSGDHEYVLVYAANKELWHPKKTERTAEHNQYYKNPDNDPRGPWNSAAYTCNKSRSQRPNLYYPIVNPNSGEEIWPDENAVWAYSKETHEQNVKDNLLYWGADGRSKSPRKKKFLFEAEKVVPRSYWHYSEVGSTQTATTDLRELFTGASFSYPKPVKLIKKIVYQATQHTDIVLDFFSGSATTAHAVMQLNAEDGGNRKFIMVQLPEACDEKSEAYKAGYANICEIGKERIRRAGKKIAAEVEEQNRQLKLGEEPKKVPDIGFRVLKIDSSNFEDVAQVPELVTMDTLFGAADNLKPNRTLLDLPFQVMPQLQIELSAPIERVDVCGATAYIVDNGRLVACFDQGVSLEVIEGLARLAAERDAEYAVMRDACFSTDADVSNFEELFKTYSPATITRVI